MVNFLSAVLSEPSFLSSNCVGFFSFPKGSSVQVGCAQALLANVQQMEKTNRKTVVLFSMNQKIKTKAKYRLFLVKIRDSGADLVYFNDFL